MMFIWLFHRISGLMLILLFGLKIASGFFLYTKDAKPEWALLAHRLPVIDIPLLVLFTFHSLYGLRTVLIDLGWGNEKDLFWVSNVLGVVASGLLVILYLATIS